METITNLTTNIAYVATTATQAATEAIYGKTEESKAATTTGNETAGKEPLSGETGDVKSGEPYDKGNDETVLGGTTAKADSTKTSHTSTLPSDSKSTDPITSNTSAVGGLNLDDKSATPNSTSTDPHSSSTVPSTTRSTLLTYATTETPSSKELNMVNATKADPIAAVPEPSVVAGPGSGPSHVAATSPSTITSTGVAAQGGNYDASHAGAGKEANHLINKADPHTPSKSTEPAAPVEEKKSLKEKIKAKLHKHKD